MSDFEVASCSDGSFGVSVAVFSVFMSFFLVFFGLLIFLVFLLF